MSGGRFTHPKLKKVCDGEYMFAGHFHILCHCYDRIVGHVIWSVSNDEGGHVTNAKSLTEAVRKLERALENAVKPQCCGVYA